MPAKQGDWAALVPARIVAPRQKAKTRGQTPLCFRCPGNLPNPPSPAFDSKLRGGPEHWSAEAANAAFRRVCKLPIQAASGCRATAQMCGQLHRTPSCCLFQWSRRRCQASARSRATRRRDKRPLDWKECSAVVSVGLQSCLQNIGATPAMTSVPNVRRKLGHHRTEERRDCRPPRGKCPRSETFPSTPRDRFGVDSKAAVAAEAVVRRCRPSPTAGIVVPF